MVRLWTVGGRSCDVYDFGMFHNRNGRAEGSSLSGFGKSLLTNINIVLK